MYIDNKVNSLIKQYENRFDIDSLICKQFLLDFLQNLYK